MFPKKKYQIIYADPPWLFRVRSEKGNKRSATNHYDVMSIQDIKDMPVQDIEHLDKREYICYKS